MAFTPGSTCARISGTHDLYYAPFGVTIVTYLGITGPEGIRLNRTSQYLEVASDELGPGSIVDGIYQGSSMEMEFVLQEANLDIVQQFLHPFQCTYTGSAVAGVRQEDHGVAGRLYSGVVGTLEAIPRPFTPAQAFTGGSATGTAGVYPGTAATTPLSGRKFYGIHIGEVMETLDATGRFIPARFRCLPWVDANDSNRIKFYKWISTYTAA